MTRCETPEVSFAWYDKANDALVCLTVGKWVTLDWRHDGVLESVDFPTDERIAGAVGLLARRGT